ncbi:MAG: hypothetical protein CM1200mP10_13570 [Candidatus Neomarinimicrobiota bacterium]|nr:MAG: hypothetical protein CM1200mP10_13570 [Candidatus Neomarinimicrobiota bacterium]
MPDYMIMTDEPGRTIDVSNNQMAFYRGCYGFTSFINEKILSSLGFPGDEPVDFENGKKIWP